MSEKLKQEQCPEGGALLMKDIDRGSVIEDEYGNKLRVEEIIRNPKYDKEGVPCVVEGRDVDSGVHVSITFGGIDINQPVADWRKWRVIKL